MLALRSPFRRCEGAAGDLLRLYRAERRRRRLKVTLPSGASFTVDVSIGGFCTEAIRVLVPDTSVTGTIEAGPGTKVAFTGRVAWNAPGDPTLDMRGRMGIAFASVGPELLDLLLGRGSTSERTP